MFAAIRAVAEDIKAQKWRDYDASRVNGLHWWQSDAARDDWRSFARSAQSIVERETFGLLLRKVVPVRPVALRDSVHQQRLALQAAIVPRGRQSLDMRRAVVLWCDCIEKGRPATSAFFEEGHEAITVTTHGYAERPQKVRVPVVVFHNTYSAPPFAGGGTSHGRASTEQAAGIVRSYSRGKLWKDGRLVEDSA